MFQHSDKWRVVGTASLLIGLLLGSCSGWKPFQDLCYRQCDGIDKSYEAREECYAKCRDDRPKP